MPHEVLLTAKEVLIIRAMLAWVDITIGHSEEEEATAKELLERLPDEASVREGEE